MGRTVVVVVVLVCGRTVVGKRNRLGEPVAVSMRDEEGTEETKERKKEKEETVKTRDDVGRKKLKFEDEGGKETMRKVVGEGTEEKWKKSVEETVEEMMVRRRYVEGTEIVEERRERRRKDAGEGTGNHLTGNLV